MISKLPFLFFILFTFRVNSHPSRVPDLLFNPEAIGFKNGNGRDSTINKQAALKLIKQ